MIIERLKPKEIDYLVEPITKSKYVTGGIVDLRPEAYAVSAKRTLEKFRFWDAMGIGSLGRDSRRMVYRTPANLYLISQDEIGKHLMTLTALLRTSPTTYQAYNWQQKQKDKRTRRELQAEGPISPTTLAREFRRALLLPLPPMPTNVYLDQSVIESENAEQKAVREEVGRSEEARGKLEIARSLINTSNQKGYEFCLMGVETFTTPKGGIKRAIPFLFIPGITDDLACDSQDSLFRGLEVFQSFRQDYAFPQDRPRQI
jgi:hypothetical protein